MKDASTKFIAQNKRAYYEYEVLQEYECGMVLRGAEVKSIKEKNIMFTDSFILVKETSVTMLNCHIGRYAYDNQRISSSEKRPIALLLQRHEIQKITKYIQQKGFTLIPLKVIQRNALLKLQIGVCRGKKEYQKKMLIKDKTIKKEIASTLAQQIRKGNIT